MNRKKRTAGIILVFAFLFVCESLSFGQCGGSARDKYNLTCITTVFLYQPLTYDSTGGSAPDTASYVAIVISLNDSDSKKEPLMFFRITDKTCSSLGTYYSGQPLPASDKITDPEKFKLLKNALRGQLDIAEKTLHKINDPIPAITLIKK